MSTFGPLDLPAPSIRPAARDAQVRALLRAGRRGFKYAVLSGPASWSGAESEHDHKLVAAIQEMWPVLARDRQVAMLPELPPVPAGERYLREFVTRHGHVLFDMARQKLLVTVQGGGGAAEVEQVLLVALAMVRAGADLGPQFERGPAEVVGQEG